jgi:hypothetical protein
MADLDGCRLGRGRKVEVGPHPQVTQLSAYLYVIFILILAHLVNLIL